MKVIIPIHSVIDVITNSSTELFVCNTSKSLEVVKESLEVMIEAYNKLCGTEEMYSFDSMFCEPRVATDEDDEVITDYSDYYSVPSVKIGETIIIEGAYDNSIPYGLLELIEEVFHAERLHLG